MDFFIGLVLLAVVVLSARWVGLLPMFFPQANHGNPTTTPGGATGWNDGCGKFRTSDGSILL
jgi:hypothetical protein